jgi:hypothetical protein
MKQDEKASRALKRIGGLVGVLDKIYANNVLEGLLIRNLWQC